MTMRLMLFIGAGALLASCGPTFDCAFSCNGCCDSSGVCQAGTQSNACGSNGATCTSCAGGSTCSAAGVCQGGNGGGFGGGFGGGSGGGGGSTGTNVLSGRATYEFVPGQYDPSSRSGTLRFDQSQVRPVRNAGVYVFQGNTKLSEDTTDENGNYTIRFTPSGSGQLTLLVAAMSRSPQIVVEDNTDNDTPWAMGGTFDTSRTTFDVHAASGWNGASYTANQRLAAPFAILDSMWTASHAFMAVRPVQFPPLRVNWSPNNVPEAGDKTMGKIGTSHYDPSVNEIFVLGADGVDADEFDSHVIVHEWGHFFEANLSRSDSPGGRHGPGDVLDPRIAFGEAWGNAVASMVLPETMYVDTAWSQGQLSAFGFDTETEPSPTDDPTPSAFSESSVLRILYDLYDANSDGAFDQVSLGLGPIYDTLTGFEKTTNAMTTLASFITGLKQQSGVDANKVNTLLARYNVGPISDEWGTGDDGLAGMYASVSVPGSANISLGGGFLPNTWQQNQYYVIQGNGSQVTVSANSAQDVALIGYRAGNRFAVADDTTSGTEHFSFQSQSGAIYVVVLTGFGMTSGDYPVSISVSSP